MRPVSPRQLRQLLRVLAVLRLWRILAAAVYQLGTASRNAAADALADLLDGGTGAGRIEVRTGTVPTNVSDASTGTLLGTLTFSATAFGSASTGVVTANSISSDTSADASGTAGYFREYQGAGGDTAAVAQGNAGTTDETMLFDNATIVAGGTIAVSSMTKTVPIS